MLLDLRALIAFMRGISMSSPRFPCPVFCIHLTVEACLSPSLPFAVFALRLVGCEWKKGVTAPSANVVTNPVRVDSIVNGYRPGDARKDQNGCVAAPKPAAWICMDRPTVHGHAWTCMDD